MKTSTRQLLSFIAILPLVAISAHDAWAQNYIYDSNTGQYLPAPVQQLPAPVQQLPAPVQQLPAPVQQLPTPVQQLPAPVQQLPAPVQQLPAPVQQLPAPVKKKSPTVQQPPKTPAAKQFVIIGDTQDGFFTCNLINDDLQDCSSSTPYDLAHYPSYLSVITGKPKLMEIKSSIESNTSAQIPKPTPQKQDIPIQRQENKTTSNKATLKTSKDSPDTTKPSLDTTKPSLDTTKPF